MAYLKASARLSRELKAISIDPPPYIHVSCDESNILVWSNLLEGPSETPYEGGWYWGRLTVTGEYPFAPPSIVMMTPSGRFEINTRLCLSMSDYHPESWQPAWSLATVLKGLLSFMCEESPTSGAIDPPASYEERQRLAKESLEWNKAQAGFLKAFPEVDRIVAAHEAQKASRQRQEQNAAAEATTAPGAVPDAAVEAAKCAAQETFLLRQEVEELRSRVAPQAAMTEVPALGILGPLAKLVP